MASARTFCPGHVTGFFEIVDGNPDPPKRGSRGAGFSITLGVATDVVVEKSDRLDIQTIINCEPADAQTTRRAVEHLLGNGRFKVEIDADVQLPVGQGFGMSAAGAFGAALGVAHALQLEHPFALAMLAAHKAEIELGTGLGDVAGQAIGGFEVRKQEGIPPFGIIERFDRACEVVLCTLGKPMETKGVLRDPVAREKINRQGHCAMHGFLKAPRIERFVEHSRTFAESTGLLSRQCEEALYAISGHGAGSMSMLGNSIFAFGEAESIEGILEDFGKVKRCKVDEKPARVVQ